MRRNLLIYIFSFVTCFLLVIFSCSKEYSKEGGNPAALASGSLQDSSGNCNTIFINGSYQPNTVFTDSNYITVQATITNPGTCTIFTDTINGFYFRGSGIVSNNGLQTIKLKAYGEPLLQVDCNFIVYFNTGHCGFVLLSSSDAAVYTFAGPGESCTNAIVNGVYTTGAPLNTSDTVNIQLNVIKPGTYNIQTPSVNGINFSAKGNFISAGNYVVALKGSGVPVAAGTTIIPVSVAGTDCSFSVTITNDAAITDSTMYWQFTANGILYHGMLDSAIRSNTININYPANNIFQLQGYGRDADSITSFINFQFNISRINNNLSEGNYHPAVAGSKDFIGYVTHASFMGNLSATNTQPSFTITVSGYDTSIRLVQGNFSGPVINETGELDTIKNGIFKTYYKKQ